MIATFLLFAGFVAVIAGSAAATFRAADWVAARAAAWRDRREGGQ